MRAAFSRIELWYFSSTLHSAVVNAMIDPFCTLARAINPQSVYLLVAIAIMFSIWASVLIPAGEIWVAAA